MLLAIYALMQFVFSPILGMLSDRYGRRPVLLVSLFGAAVDYLIMAFAPALWFLFVGRAIAGLTSANFAVATAYLADITPEDERARRFGLPARLLRHRLHSRARLSAARSAMSGCGRRSSPRRSLNAGNFALALFVLPESHRGRAEARHAFELQSVRLVALGLHHQALLPLMALYFLFNFIGQVYGTVWALYGHDRFGWDTFMIGVSLAGFGVFHAGSQALLTGSVTGRLGPRLSLIAGMVCETAGLVLLAFVGQGWMVFVLLPLFALGGIGLPALQSLLTNTVDGEHQGQLQGVLGSLLSLASIFGPLVFSSIYFLSAAELPGAVWLFTAVVYLATIPLILRTPRAVFSEPANSALRTISGKIAERPTRSPRAFGDETDERRADDRADVGDDRQRRDVGCRGAVAKPGRCRHRQREAERHANAQRSEANGGDVDVVGDQQHQHADHRHDGAEAPECDRAEAIRERVAGQAADGHGPARRIQRRSSRCRARCR